mmetsp:Transcript_23945/g.38389  ORF Transcript_23945/g.38389 Transcript_23945/m.38389 type:complete len:213 (-) Transcript_23945:41-679(-)
MTATGAMMMRRSIPRLAAPASRSALFCRAVAIPSAPARSPAARALPAILRIRWSTRASAAASMLPATSRAVGALSPRVPAWKTRRYLTARASRSALTLSATSPACTSIELRLPSVAIPKGSSAFSPRTCISALTSIQAVGLALGIRTELPTRRSQHSPSAEQALLRNLPPNSSARNAAHPALGCSIVWSSTHFCSVVVVVVVVALVRFLSGW